ncbi:hypothetical protein FRX31_033117 [Thalictrum thalictroides]|uniref:Uncharacterized protein n=1 Tax=Thalictrum thalictroides TaxID=46969 RepID=A0A7J6UXG7_THATH|nr:hypothetical protein FRX31_033117 [Thalictrum thalictroides]
MLLEVENAGYATGQPVQGMILDIMRDSESEDEDWRAQLSFDCTLCCLKSIVIKNCEGCRNEFIFVEFLLKKALALEHMVIQLTSKSSAEEKNLVTFSNQIRSLPTASSNVAVPLAL